MNMVFEIVDGSRYVTLVRGVKVSCFLATHSVVETDVVEIVGDMTQLEFIVV